MAGIEYDKGFAIVIGRSVRAEVVVVEGSSSCLDDNPVVASVKAASISGKPLVNGKVHDAVNVSTGRQATRGEGHSMRGLESLGKASVVPAGSNHDAVGGNHVGKFTSNSDGTGDSACSNRCVFFGNQTELGRNGWQCAQRFRRRGARWRFARPLVHKLQAQGVFRAYVGPDIVGVASIAVLNVRVASRSLFVNPVDTGSNVGELKVSILVRDSRGDAKIVRVVQFHSDPHNGIVSSIVVVNVFADVPIDDTGLLVHKVTSGNVLVSHQTNANPVVVGTLHIGDIEVSRKIGLNDSVATSRQVVKGVLSVWSGSRSGNRRVVLVVESNGDAFQVLVAQVVVVRVFCHASRDGSQQRVRGHDAQARATGRGTGRSGAQTRSGAGTLVHKLQIGLALLRHVAGNDVGVTPVAVLHVRVSLGRHLLDHIDFGTQPDKVKHSVFVRSRGPEQCRSGRVVELHRHSFNRDVSFVVVVSVFQHHTTNEAFTLIDKVTSSHVPSKGKVHFNPVVVGSLHIGHIEVSVQVGFHNRVVTRGQVVESVKPVGSRDGGRHNLRVINVEGNGDTLQLGVTIVVVGCVFPNGSSDGTEGVRGGGGGKGADAGSRAGGNRGSSG